MFQATGSEGPESAQMYKRSTCFQVASFPGSPPPRSFIYLEMSDAPSPVLFLGPAYSLILSACAKGLQYLVCVFMSVTSLHGVRWISTGFMLKSEDFQLTDFSKTVSIRTLFGHFGFVSFGVHVTSIQYVHVVHSVPAQQTIWTEATHCVVHELRDVV